MRKKLVGIILAVVMCITSVIPAVADDIDPTAQAFYDACVNLETAIAGSSVDEVKTAYEAFEVLSEIEEWSDAQLEDLNTLFGMDMEEKIYDILSDIISAAVIIATDEVYDAYVADKNVKTALDFVQTYDSLFGEDGMASEGESKDMMYRFFPEIDTVYADALTNAPSDEATAVYEAITSLEESFEFESIEMVEETIDTYSDVFESLDSLDDAVKAEVAALLEADYDDVVENVNTLLDVAAKLSEINETYNTFLDEYTAEAAQAYVDMYDALYADGADEALQTYAEAFFYDLEDVYEEAKIVLDEEDDNNKNNNDNKNNNKKDDDSDKKSTDTTHKVGKSDKTGDTRDFAFVMLIMSGAAVILLTVFRKKVTA